MAPADLNQTRILVLRGDMKVLRILEKPSWREMVWGALSGVMLLFAFPSDAMLLLARIAGKSQAASAGAWPLAWLALVPLLRLCAASPRRSVVPAYLAGLIWFVGGLAWVRHATVAGFLLLGPFLALYVVAFALTTGVLRRHTRLPLAIVAPFVWVTLEAVRSNVMTGFPYLLLGHTQIANLRLMQILDVTGVYGVSFIIVAVNALLAEFPLLIDRNLRRAVESRTDLRFSPKAFAVSLAAVVCALAGLLVYGTVRIDTLETHPGPEVCLVQGNVEQDVKIQWTAEMRTDVLDSYRKLTARVIEEAAGDNPLLIWPESSVPGFYNERDPALRDCIAGLLRDLKFERMLIGMNYAEVVEAQAGPNAEPEIKLLNSALYLDGNPYSLGSIERYDKMHLVPFGEYVPLSKLLFFVKNVVDYVGVFSPGTEYKLFEHDGCPFAAVICYEDVFPGLVRRFAGRGARFMVNISNEGWFFRSAELDQHLQIARCRAIENRVGMVRCTNSGISCLIDPAGRVEKVIADSDGNTKLVAGWLAGRVTLGSGSPTFYTRYGDVFAIGCIAAMLALCVGAWIASRRRPRGA